MGAVEQDLPKCPSFVVAKSEARGLAGWRVFAAGNVDPLLSPFPFLRLAATPSANEDEEAETLQGYPLISGRGCVTP